MCAFDSLLDSKLMGVNRMLALAEPALREACMPLTNVAGPLQRVPIYMGLPEKRPGFGERDIEQFRRGIEQIEGLPIQLSSVNLIPQGHAAGLLALKLAFEHLQKGTSEACLVGGVDSYLQPDTLEWLDDHLQLARAEARSAFVPGEGAGFCLLVGSRTANRFGWNSLARVRSVSSGQETRLIKTPEVCVGEGLTTAVRSAVSDLSLPAEKIHHVICDINGERYRGEEWGFCCLRLSSYFEDPSAYRTPVDCWGDMGAASGPLFAILACQATARGYAKGPRTLLWASSEAGLRAAALLETSMHAGTRGLRHG
ncbi:beta-ketoacyl synthase N-terminal-like domain-containing protein [Myxococcus llanfairpwllgwyngyllgogerychwyrndrobwllllantysiliogogogochensis]|nr:beta-ketoacyl synthase N-terminal-like domain-containing protein [Myxococcus llanfairpwllgwyngyllgogerychwyrndrobwllllantysiliogogogochensis]